MHLVITLIVGLVVGALARLVLPGKDPGGVVVTLLLGVAGSFIAGMIGQAVGWYGVGEGPSVIASVLGAVILLGIYRMVAHPRRTW